MAFNVGVNILFVIYITAKKIYQKIRICCYKKKVKKQKELTVAPKEEVKKEKIE